MDRQALIEVGAALQGRRKAAKLTLAQVSKELKIRKDYIQGIEKGDVHLIPFEAYVLGYVKHYAILLGLDPKDYIVRIKSDEQKLSSVASKNLITFEQFLPSKKVIIISFSLMIMIYIALALFK
jgi:cytoskeleton protein RodZ